MARVAFQPGAKLERFGKKLEKPEGALKQIGQIMVAASQQAFRDQRFDEEPWDERSDVNVFGIISDFAQGRTKPPKRRFQTRPALVDTGRLRSSIAFRLVGDASVEVGTVVDYAEVHQEGGEVQSETITDKVQKLLGEWLPSQDQEIQDRLKFLLLPSFRGKRLTATVPERRFIGFTDQIADDVAEIIGIAIFEVRP